MTPNGVHFTIGSTTNSSTSRNWLRPSSGCSRPTSSMHQSVSDRSVRMICNSKIVASLFLSMVGTGYRSKRLSHDVLTADEEFQRGLLAGLFRGDGCQYHRRDAARPGESGIG